MKKANELLKKGLGVDLPLLGNQEKTRLVDALRDAYTLPELFAELDLAPAVHTFIIGHGCGSPTSMVTCIAPLASLQLPPPVFGGRGRTGRVTVGASEFTIRDPR